MTDFNSIGVIGQGFVGTAVREGLRHAFDVATYNKKEEDVVYTYLKPCTTERAERQKPMRHPVGGVVYCELLRSVDGPIFVCVPTPMKLDGSCDISIIHDVLHELQAAARELDRRVVVILKSTVPPGTTAALNDLYDDLDICFNPEFLREVSPNEDFANQDRIILGGVGNALEQALCVFEKAFPSVRICCMYSVVAEMVKYVTNVFLATKVSLANEISQVCGVLGIDYEEVWKVVALDKRLTESHWMVPGPDGHYGFGGSCFPKDLNSLMHIASENGVDPKVMRAVWEKNLEVRPERDWEQLIGRAVVDDTPE